MFQKIVICAAVVALLVLASGCLPDSGKETSSSGIDFPDESRTAEQPPALPSDGAGDSLPSLPGEEGDSLPSQSVEGSDSLPPLP